MIAYHPGDPAYEQAVQVFNLTARPRPAAALTARTVDEVRAAVQYAVAEGLPVRVHSTGHAAAAVRPVSDALLIRTELAGGVEIDPLSRTARVSAGTKWGDVVAAAAPYGLAAPHGSSADVGVVGYLLRGGLSLYGRWIGLAANSVRAIELVTADGELCRADASSDPQLLWAVRGGGGGFGIVTAIEFELFPLRHVITGASYWPAVHAGRLLSAWRSWAVEAPATATTSVRIMNLPKVPDVPAALSEGPVLALDGAFISQDAEHRTSRRQYADMMEPLCAIADPLLETWADADPLAVVEAHMDPTVPMPFVGDHMLLDELEDDGMHAFLAVAGEGSGSPLIASGLRQLGGAFAVPKQAGGVLDHLTAHYSYAGAGLPGDAVTVASIKSHHAKVRAALSPWDTGRTAPTFVETWDQPQGHLDTGQMLAVQEIRSRVDPGGLFSEDIASCGVPARSR